MHMLEQHQGKDHVSAQDQADENMADSGDGVYIAKYKGEYMEVSMESANQLTVSAGALWVNGRFCIVDPAETLTVDNGSSGMTEYDLVCVHWKETTATQQVALAEGGTKEVSTTVEKTELVIVKGDPASSGATDPEISQTTIRAGVGEAWVPFARITKDGLTPSVAFIVDRLAPESDFRDSISHVLFESATGTYDKTITLNDNISNYKRIKVFYGADTTGDKIVSADCCEFLPIVSTFVLSAITFIGNEGGSSIKTKRFNVAENSFTAVSAGSGIAFTQTNYREQGYQFIKIYKVVGYTV